MEGNSVILLSQSGDELGRVDDLPLKSIDLCAKAELFFVNDNTGGTKAYNLDFEEVWSFETQPRPGRESQGPVHASALPGGELFIVDAGNTLLRLDPASGAVLWESSGHRFDLQDVLEAPDGSLRVVARVNRVVAYSLDGAELWLQDFYSGEQQWQHHIAISPEGVTYFCPQGEALHMISSTGHTLWSKPLSAPVDRMTAGLDNRVYLIDSANQLVCYDQQGELLWTTEGFDIVMFGPHIGSDGAVYVGSYSRLYCFEP